MTNQPNESAENNTKRLQTLESTKLFLPEQIQALQGRWIETIEQFLSITTTPEGRIGMVRLLELDELELDEIRKRLFGLVPSKSHDEIKTQDTGGAMGAILPNVPKKNGGCSEGGEIS